MEAFKKKNIFSRMLMSQEEINSYHRKLRIYNYLIDKPLTKLKLHKLTNYISLKILKIDRYIVKRSFKIEKDERVETGRPHIYACSHVGRFDIETAMEAIGKDAYFVMGDPNETYRNFEGLFLNAYGRLCMDTGYQLSDELTNIKKYDITDPKVLKQVSDYLHSDYADPELVHLVNEYLKYFEIDSLLIDALIRANNYEIIDVEHLKLLLEYKLDRKAFLHTGIKYLKANQNLLIYPEAAWNLSPNELTMKLFSGTAQMALASGADIIPIGIVRYDKNYIVSIGKNIYPEDYQSSNELTLALRDTLSTLKYEIIEKEPQLLRENVPLNALQLYVDDIMKESSNGYDIDVINKSKYIDKMPKPDEVFGPLKKLSKF